MNKNIGGFRMKRWLFFICAVIIVPQLLIGCAANNNVGFKELYSQVNGFIENDDKAIPVPQDTILMVTNDDFRIFKDKYFTPREIQIQSPDKENAVLYLQIPSATSSVYTYKVQSINIKDNTLTVNLNNSSIAQADSKSGLNYTWKWVMFVEIYKTNLQADIKIVINKNG